jgi:AcrR family transcriptional regulator
MGDGRKLTSKGLATRETLIAAAERAFAESGYEGTRIADIVRNAGVSHGNFYRHFKDKDDILLVILNRLHDHMRTTTSRGGDPSLVPTEAQLADRNVRFFKNYRPHRHMLRVAREAAAGNASSFRALWLDMRRVFIHRTQRWIEALQAHGHVADDLDAAMTAEALGAMVEQMAYVNIGLAEGEPPDHALEAMGRACGLIWHRTLFAAAPAGTDRGRCA